MYASSGPTGTEDFGNHIKRMIAVYGEKCKNTLNILHKYGVLTIDDLLPVLVREGVFRMSTMLNTIKNREKRDTLYAESSSFMDGESTMCVRSGGYCTMVAGGKSLVISAHRVGRNEDEYWDIELPLWPGAEIISTDFVTLLMPGQPRPSESLYVKNPKRKALSPAPTTPAAKTRPVPVHTPTAASSSSALQGPGCRSPSPLTSTPINQQKNTFPLKVVSPAELSSDDYPAALSEVYHEVSSSGTNILIEVGKDVTAKCCGKLGKSDTELVVPIVMEVLKEKLEGGSLFTKEVMEATMATFLLDYNNSVSDMVEKKLSSLLPQLESRFLGLVTKSTSAVLEDLKHDIIDQSVERMSELRESSSSLLEKHLNMTLERSREVSAVETCGWCKVDSCNTENCVVKSSDIFKFCLMCMEENHSSKNCTHPLICSTCNQQGHTANLHVILTKRGKLGSRFLEAQTNLEDNCGVEVLLMKQGVISISQLGD